MTTAHVAQEFSMAEAKSRVVYSVLRITGHDDCSCRLHELGIGEGTTVMIERAGNPAIVRIGSSKLALSAECLHRIKVEPVR
ncbi:MAG: ferrous iron transport protein A [Planctomycetes bacterium]|nr:ferrous iron transport protein A [Planctomycetota bacterium]NUQ35229.1 ferrous iron transport protein A [Planctomycetaceae bacterium]